MTSSRREERKRRWQERKFHERLAIIVIPIIVVGLIVVFSFALSWVTTPSAPSLSVQHAQLRELRAETNAWNQIAAGNKTLAHCYATDTPCWP